MSKGKAKFDELVLRARPAEPAEYAAVVATQPGKARSLITELPFVASLKAGGPGELKATQKALVLYFTVTELRDAYKNHPAHRAVAVKQAVASSAGGTTLGPWAKDLIRDKKGSVMNLTANMTTVLEHDPRWSGVLAFDLLANDVVFLRAPSFSADFLLRTKGDKWVDEDDVSLANWFQREFGINAKPNQIRPIVALAARRREFCPIKTRLSSLSWDGVPRVSEWLTRYLGVAPAPYSKRVGEMWLISGVARAFEPGCQVDYVIVFEGAQRIGKSSFLRILALDDLWFTDDVKNVGDVEAAKQLRSKWLVEFSELAAIRRRDLETIKSFVTRRIDNYRASYARSALDYPRRAFFAGTVNRVGDRGYLADPSGNERWWPVVCTKLDRRLLLEEREQLWAEAVVRYKAGEHWWPTDEERATLLTPEQEERREKDAWEERIAAWLQCSITDAEGKDYVTVDQLLDVVLEVPKGRQDGLAAGRVANILHVLGWEPTRVREDGRRFRAWKRGPAAERYAQPDPKLRDVGETYEEMIN